MIIITGFEDEGWEVLTKSELVLARDHQYFPRKFIKIKSWDSRKNSLLHCNNLVHKLWWKLVGHSKSIKNQTK